MHPCNRYSTDFDTVDKAIEFIGLSKHKLPSDTRIVDSNFWVLIYYTPFTEADGAYNSGRSLTTIQKYAETAAISNGWTVEKFDLEEEEVKRVRQFLFDHPKIFGKVCFDWNNLDHGFTSSGNCRYLVCRLI